MAITSDNCSVQSVVNDYTGTDNASAVYPEGTTVVTWTVTDINGNAVSCTQSITVNDTENPTITCPDDVLQTADNGVCEALVTIGAPVVDDNCAVDFVINDYNNSADATDIYPVGTTTVVWTVTDIHGNSSTCEQIIVIEDNEAPMITCPDDVLQTADAGMCDAVVSIDIPVTSDNCGVANVTNDYNNTDDATDTYPVGTTTIVWTVTDIYGNESTCTQTVVITDDEDPMITCADDMVQVTDPGLCEAFVAVSTPVVSDNCDVASIVNDYTGTDDASAVYPEGTTTVLWTVTDIYGNINTCEQEITINDEEAPSITCPEDVIQNADSGVCDADVSIAAPLVDDNCGVLTFTNDYSGTADASDNYPV